MKSNFFEHGLDFRIRHEMPPEQAISRRIHTSSIAGATLSVLLAAYLSGTNLMLRHKNKSNCGVSSCFQMPFLDNSDRQVVQS